MSHKVKVSAEGDVRILTLSDPATLNAADNLIGSGADIDVEP